ncbi:uncharacterized protein LOC123003679 isoform X1 [Tribolium madens]|uniref:uncharacterized protein LOC123003679 isoform X1 n=1 Tax=Tribolium madens TaxID=41895 RepID=UPI001CF7492C|nr:uncharacterized protein LOC123003679 isoform X1 [Tribolium madens]
MFGTIVWLVTALQILVDICIGLRLTNMTAPALQDPRKDMELHCRFDMGGEELYAVKWYKDDHEFFRYTPAAAVSITQFPVDGVHVDGQNSRCMPEGCDLLLKELSRPQSSGAYRCEVSSEAPAFRLASQTHNVTVAALPEERPKIEHLQDSYLLGDELRAKCTSGFGDPKPTLTWYLNKQPVSGKLIQELSSSPTKPSTDRIHLKSTISILSLHLDKKIAQNRARTPLEISCESSIDGINQAVAPPLTTTKTIMVLDQNQIVNNQKLHSPYSGGSKVAQKVATVVLLVVGARWC